jgi:hypothetical protein
MDEKASIEAFVGKKADYYRKKWEIPEGHSAPPLTVNKAAVFAGLFWLAYRKLYVPVLGVIAVIIADVQLETWLEARRFVSNEMVAAWDRLSPFVYGGVIGVFGNRWYWKKYRRIAEQAGAQSPDLTIQEVFLRKKGGPSVLSVCIGIAIIAGFVALVLVSATPPAGWPPR